MYQYGYLQQVHYEERTTYDGTFGADDGKHSCKQDEMLGVRTVDASNEPPPAFQNNSRMFPPWNRETS